MGSEQREREEKKSWVSGEVRLSGGRAQSLVVVVLCPVSAHDSPGGAKKGRRVCCKSHNPAWLSSARF